MILNNSATVDRPHVIRGVAIYFNKNILFPFYRYVVENVSLCLQHGDY